METLQYCLRKLLYGIPLIIGVTMISFLLMVYFAPNKTYELAGKNATPQRIAEIRHQLGYDRSLIARYAEYLKETVTLNFGNSDSSGEKVTTMFINAVPVSLAVELPGFVIGNLLGIALALWAAYNRGKMVDKMIMSGAVIGMSISYIIVAIVFQNLLCSSIGLNFFPVSGWEVFGLGDYLFHVTVPTMINVFVAVGYNTRFYRAVFVEEFTRDHVRTSKAFGSSAIDLLKKNVLKNSMVPIITRIMFSLPYLIIGGSLIIENYFSIPGIGSVIFNAIATGDLPVLKASVSLTAILYIIILSIIDILYKMFDPRITLET